MEEGPEGLDPLLPHELPDEVERGDLARRKPRRRPLPVFVGGARYWESTSGAYVSNRLAIPIAVTCGLLYVAFQTAPCWFALVLGGLGTRGDFGICALICIGLAFLWAIALSWACRDRLAEAAARRGWRKRRAIAAEMVRAAHGKDVAFLLYVGIAHGIARIHPPGSFQDFLAFLDVQKERLVVWWVKGRESGVFQIPKSGVIRVWPVELWRKHGSNVSVDAGPPDLMVPYVEYMDPVLQRVQILSFESAEEVTPAKIQWATGFLADRLSVWLVGRRLSEVFVPASVRAIQPRGGAPEGSTIRQSP